MNTRILGFLIAFFLVSLSSLQAQQPFALYIQPSALSVPATHSGAFAEWNGKWIFIGGRIDGLHIMQAMQAFPTYGRNDSIYIVDPLTNTHTSLDATQLLPDIYEAVTSSNMQFYQDGRYLYMIGGYGRMATQNVWKTFPSLVAVDLECLVLASMTGSAPGACFRQITDTNMAVAGGMLEKIDSTYYLVFGHRFDGMYARTNLGGMFTQQYTHEIRRFSIRDNGVNLSLSNYSALQDTNLYHRRDLNLVPQIFPTGEYGITAFGGVFQKLVDLPFLTPIDITPTTVQHQNGFNQNLSQYTSAVVPVYDSVTNFMHTIFFGGMSLFTLDTITQTLVQDTAVPFVSTVSKISRDGLGNLTEYKLPVNMPGLIGSNAVFITDPLVPKTHERIVNLNRLTGITKIGYIVGGIQSDYPNVGLLDPEGMSRPNAQVYEVFIDRTVSSTHELLVKNDVNNLAVFPNPTHEKVTVEFSAGNGTDCEVDFYNLEGRRIRTLLPSKKLTGDQHFDFQLGNLKPGTYLCRVRVGDSVKGVKVVVR
ncbi:MAG TPA: T9SS type A sorting domain-containing protein [Bacteroidia bacterium]|nr:T9SS type A sorting domain-containing protein [Bacteroidia bacterium]